MVQDPPPNQKKSKHSKTTREKDLQLDQFTVLQDIKEADLHAKNLETEDILHNTSDSEITNPLMGINNQKMIADPQQELSSFHLSPPLLQEKNITHATQLKTKEPSQQNSMENIRSSKTTSSTLHPSEQPESATTPSLPQHPNPNTEHITQPSTQTAPSSPSAENNTPLPHIENKNDTSTLASFPHTSHIASQTTSNATAPTTLKNPIIEQETPSTENAPSTPANTAPENSSLATPETRQPFTEENIATVPTAFELEPTPEPAAITPPPSIEAEPEAEQLYPTPSPTEHLNEQISPAENINAKSKEDEIKTEMKSKPLLENIDTDHDRGHGNDADKSDEDNPSLSHKMPEISHMESKNTHERDKKDKKDKHNKKDNTDHDDDKDDKDHKHHNDHQEEKNHHSDNEHNHSQETYKKQFLDHNENDRHQQEFFDFHAHEHSANNHTSWLDALEIKNNHSQTHENTNNHDTQQVNWLETIENHQEKTGIHNNHNTDKHHNDALPDVQIHDDSNCNNNDPTSGIL